MTSRAFIWTATVVLSGYVWFAPAVAAQSPSRATIAYGLAHREPGARNVLRLLDLAGRADVPVYLGRETPRGAHNPFPEAWRAVSDTMTGLTLPAPRRSPEPRAAVEFLAERLRDPSRPVDVLALGAHTNLADALERQPRLAAVRSLVIMGGAVDVPGNLNAGWKSENTTAEWNLYADPEAARRVLAARLPILLVPLDATNAVRVDGAFLREVQQRATTPLGRVVSDVLASASDLVDTGQYYAWDPLAAVALIDRSVVRTERLSVSILLSPPEDGRTVRDQGGTSIEVALGADAKRFLDLFVTTLAQQQSRVAVSLLRLAAEAPCAGQQAIAATFRIRAEDAQAARFPSVLAASSSSRC